MRVFMKTRFNYVWSVSLLSLALLGCSTGSGQQPEVNTKDIDSDAPILSAREAPDSEWVNMLQGNSLEGWIPKFTGHLAGENILDTFKVEDGILSIDYSKWESMDRRFGHLFSEQSYSHYVLRLEYRFVGSQIAVPDSMAWARRNNGAMLHSQSASSMQLDQEFPVSLEAQLLGYVEGENRTTGNLCTPGTHAVISGELVEEHCVKSQFAAIAGEQWVRAEFEVLGSDRIRHYINGELVFELSDPVFDTNSPEAVAVQNNGPLLIEGGHIAFQAESHPTQFRNVQLFLLDPS